MRTIDADKVIEKLKEHKSLFCKNRVEFRALSDKDKARVDEIDTCIAELVNAEEVPHAQLGTNLAEVGTDCISRQAAIDAVMECYDNDELFEVYEEKLRELPPAQPEHIRGRWIIRETSSGDTEARCSHCGFTTLVDEPGNGLHMVSDLNFCPNCGADMRGEKDGRFNQQTGGD